nr:MAG TPA: hypothetical protein [Caudoviricetes sp.]
MIFFIIIVLYFVPALYLPQSVCFSGGNPYLCSC